MKRIGELILIIIQLHSIENKCILTLHPYYCLFLIYTVVDFLLFHSVLILYEVVIVFILSHYCFKISANNITTPIA